MAYVPYIMLDPDQVVDDGTYSAVIGRDCLAGGRINIKVYAEGKPGVSKLNLNPLGTYISNSKRHFDLSHVAF